MLKELKGNHDTDMERYTVKRKKLPKSMCSPIPFINKRHIYTYMYISTCKIKMNIQWAVNNDYFGAWKK